MNPAPPSTTILFCMTFPFYRPSEQILFHMCVLPAAETASVCERALKANAFGARFLSALLRLLLDEERLGQLVDAGDPDNLDPFRAACALGQIA